MTREQAERNIKLYFWFQVFKEPLFWGPILITFINRVSGMTLSDIYLMEAVCVVGIVLLDCPCGALADLLGRRLTILIGICVWSVKLAVFASATSPLTIWLANFLWVIGASLISGADTSMLADTLKFLGRESEFQKIEGRSSAYRLALVAACSATVGYLAEVNLRLPVWLGVPFMIIACVAAYRMIDPPVIIKREKSWQEYFRLLKLSALFVYNHRQVKWVIGFSVLIGAVSKIWFFTYNPYFELVELPLKYFGWMFCLLNVVAAISSHEAERITRRCGEFGGIVLMVLLIALPIWLMGAWVTKWAVLLILMQNLVRGYMTPFLGFFLHRHLDSENRATVASIKSTANSVAGVVSLGLFGLAVKYWSLAFCLELLGVSALLAGLVMIATYHRTFNSR
ncbi:MAG: MFS transporter [Patescibacteria group bacterium]